MGPVKDLLKLQFDSNKRAEHLATYLIHRLPTVMFHLKQNFCDQTESDLTLQQLRILSLLSEGECEFSSDLAEALNVSQPAISRSTHFMEQEGWIKKSASDHDKRQSKIQLTELGAKCLRQASQCSTGKLLEQLNKLSEKELRDLKQGVLVLESLIQKESF